MVSAISIGGAPHTAMPQLCPSTAHSHATAVPQALLVWLIHIPALPSEPGAGWVMLTLQTALQRDLTLHLLSGSGRQEWEFEGRRIGLGFIFSQSLRK